MANAASGAVCPKALSFRWRKAKDETRNQTISHGARQVSLVRQRHSWRFPEPLESDVSKVWANRDPDANGKDRQRIRIGPRFAGRNKAGQPTRELLVDKAVSQRGHLHCELVGGAGRWVERLALGRACPVPVLKATRQYRGRSCGRDRQTSVPGHSAKLPTVGVACHRTGSRAVRPPVQAASPLHPRLPFRLTI